MEKRFVYADNAATTKVSDNVYKAMQPYLQEQYGNASSIYSIARQAKAAIEKSRQKAADALHADVSEIYFTSCGTESDNWAIRGYANAMKIRGKTHIITTNFEHHAVLHTCQALQKEGFSITYLPVDENGLISVKDVENAIQENTGLVTIMYANNEIGTILPIPEIGELCREKNIVLHTDAVQAVGNIPIDLSQQKIDMLALSGHKIHAPKGIGLLYIRKGITPKSIMYGGAQERGKRPGTENVAYIVALGQAIEDAVKNMEAKNMQIEKLQDQLIEGIYQIPKVRLNGDRKNRLKNNVNFSFQGIEGEGILLKLDLNGICASSGSACTSGSLDPSHVLLAIGLDHATAHGSLRLSLSEWNSKEDIDYILKCLPPIIQELRNMSPIWNE